MRNDLSPLKTSVASSRTGELTIGDLARIYDVSLRTLRFYEDRNLLHPRREGTARFYSGKERFRLELILKGKRLGFTLAEIEELIVSQAKRPVVAGEENSDLIVGLGSAQIESQITHLERQRRDLDVAIGELQQALDHMRSAKV